MTHHIYVFGNANRSGTVLIIDYWLLIIDGIDYWFLITACAPDILTMNMTHTGELGYVFYIPNEFALHVYDSILEAGKGGKAWN